MAHILGILPAYQIRDAVKCTRGSESVAGARHFDHRHQNVGLLHFKHPEVKLKRTDAEDLRAFCIYPDTAPSRHTDNLKFGPVALRLLPISSHLVNGTRGLIAFVSRLFVRAASPGRVPGNSKPPLARRNR